ncbi:MAG: P1 family peptidase [Chloroflexota bacterium]
MPKARTLGIPFNGETGPLNAITDVAGVEVGHTTLISGEGDLVVGQGPVRTGVTAVLPRGKRYAPVMAGWYALNGNGEMTGTTWVEESGFLESPIMITNTHSVGAVHEAVIAWSYKQKLYSPRYADVFWSLPVVGETYDGVLNDINGFHVKQSHVFAALDQATSGDVAEGCVGGGTGMICHGFKGGIGSSSRIVLFNDVRYTVGVIVQANYGSRQNLMIAGQPVGKLMPDLMPEINQKKPANRDGSIIVIVATDAPLLPHQLKRLARRVPLGIARVGGMGADSSGDIFIAFSTANEGAAQRHGVGQVAMLPNDQMTPIFEATVFATEEAIVNALTSATTMTGINGNTVHAIPNGRLRELFLTPNV